MQRPPFSKLENYSPNPHPEALPKALQTLKDLRSDEDIWEYSDKKEGVTLRQFPREGDAVPHVRGDGSIDGYSIEEILAVIHQQSCRAVWDVRYETGFPVETYDRNTIGFWASQKGSGYLVWPRDFTGIAGHIQEKEGDKEVSYYLQTSVEMKNVPEFPSSYVRGTLSVAGWILRPAGEANKVDLTYIVHVDPAGYIPSSLVALVVAEIPMCIARVRGYLADNGFPVYIPHNTEDFPGIMQGETFDPTSNTFDAKWKPHGAGVFNIYYDKSRWTAGAKVVPGDNTSEADFKVTQSDGKVTITFEEGVKDKNLHIVVKKA
ncbi:hypothetical protein PILCRDRAFT_814970 [Piloderma croceum F 1598]|uniref:START domain-containing protein n=1 Tax=Piloderma croceum (strain F 1598) TaxID=765440 RepID=A0A0C3CCN2_PILCF|nr:hypothetical protein PILCRDRAFT_814970 [Piloderma croceum F 1598]